MKHIILYIYPAMYAMFFVGSTALNPCLPAYMHLAQDQPSQTTSMLLQMLRLSLPPSSARALGKLYPNNNASIALGNIAEREEHGGRLVF